MTDNTQTVVAVTRNGRGDLWRFDTEEEAYRHPLIQYGDPVLTCPADVRRFFNRQYIDPLLLRLEDEDFRQMVMRGVEAVRSQQELESVYRQYQDHIFKRMIHRAASVPQDPGKVFELIVYDRDRYNVGLKGKTMNATATDAPTAPAKEKKAKYAADAKITLLADKEGNSYGPKNNPKREGSKAHARFASYKTGMTVEAFLKGDGTTADLDNDVAKGFIKVD